MVKIVTGKINSYKSTRLLELYNKDHLGDGFIAKKIMKNDLVMGYDLVQLSNKKEIPFIRRDIYDKGIEDVIYQLGPYHFFKSAFEYVEKEVEDFSKRGVSPIYLDEISLLELEENGFHKVLVKLLKKEIDLCLVVRVDLLDRVLEKYQIKDKVII
ncbi:MAG: nucleoside-triphosphatase [Candidatus Izemoplasmatales bacterium]|nr:nucleoside-triphosphatase [Candidatus Izemoplasmatales bacterium]